jgi:hypothetical protein
MSTIVAAHFQLQEQVEQARARLLEAGFHENLISSFFITPPGQHDLTPIGGDRDESPGAKETPQALTEGVAAGGVVGAALGAATAGVTGPVGPIVGALVGAHVGSLLSFSKMKEAGQAEGGGPAEDAPRKGGMLLAAVISGPEQQQRAVQLLREQGGEQLECAEGRIVEGNWIDFNPLSTPVLLR